MGRAPCCDKANVKKGPWSPEEDAKLKDYIEKYGTGGHWIALPQKIGLKRCGKSCRLRWLNYLRPNIKHGGFTEEEDRIICSLYISIGSRWSVIAAQLPGRTDNDIKNYWNTKLKKKLLGKQKNSNSRLSPNGTDEIQLSNTALERLQLHMQAMQLQTPLYNDPILWPRLNPIQNNTVQNLNNNASLNQITLPTSQMHEELNSDPSHVKVKEDYGIESSLNGTSSSENNSISYNTGNNFLECLNSISNLPRPDIQQVSTLQNELDDILNNKSTDSIMPQVYQAAEFGYHKELNAAEGKSMWWTNNFESTSTSSWDSSSGFQADQDIIQDYELDYNL